MMFRFILKLSDVVLDHVVSRGKRNCSHDANDL